MTKQTLGQKIQTQIGHAIKDYDLIRDGDRILCAISGGKDSLTMLKLLNERRQWAPVQYELYAVNIKTDFSCGSCMHKDVLSQIFAEWNIPFEFAHMNVLNEDKTTNCFWCSWNRRKCLFEVAQRLGCNKIALGHHKDDVIETTLLNIIFQGNFSTMNPKQELFNGEKAIIRPLCYVEEDLIKAFALEQNFPSKLCRCPFGETSRRKHIKEWIAALQKQTPGTNIKTNIFKSVFRVKEDYIDVKTPPEDLSDIPAEEDPSSNQIYLCG